MSDRLARIDAARCCEERNGTRNGATVVGTETTGAAHSADSNLDGMIGAQLANSSDRADLGYS